MKKETLRGIALFLLILITAVVLFSLIFPPGQKVEPMNYSAFITQALQKKVSKALIVENSIEADLTNGSKVKVYAPNDPDMIKLLRENSVVIEAKPPEAPVWTIVFQGVLYGGVFIFIIWWFMTMRQVQGGSGQAMAFGKSKAKLFSGGPSKTTFADVAGVEEAKEELQEIIEFLKDPKKFQILGGRIPKGVLLVGPTGTGKTLLARAVAGEAGVPFFYISGSDFVEMFVGVGASRVRDLFEQGKRSSPCIIFIDEIDAVGRHRGAGLGGGHDEREQTLNQLLVEIDGFDTTPGVIMIAATNRPDVLDPALLRPGRFDRQVVVDRPDLKGREAILKVHARKVILAPEVDMNTIARRTPGFSGADLANLINEGALLAARLNKKAVEMEDLEEAIERVISGPERHSRVISEKEKKVIAYHECGHALVACFVPSTSPVHKVSIIPRGHSTLGYTLQLPTEDRFLSMKKEILADISTFLGGRSAEQLIFGEISTGAYSDLDRATRLAHKMVCEFGMSEKLGAMTFGRKEEQVFLGRDLFKDKNYSEKTAEVIDMEVKNIIDTSQQRAEKILRKHRQKLTEMAEALLKKEILESDEVKKILGIIKREDEKTPAIKSEPKGRKD